MIESKCLGSNLGLSDIKRNMGRNDIINETNEFVLNRRTLSIMIQRNPQLLIDLNNFINSNKYTLVEIADMYYTLTDGGFNAYNQCVNLFGKKYRLSIDDEIQDGRILLLNNSKDVIFEFEDHAIN